MMTSKIILNEILCHDATSKSLCNFSWVVANSTPCEVSEAKHLIITLLNLYLKSKTTTLEAMRKFFSRHINFILSRRRGKRSICIYGDELFSINWDFASCSLLQHFGILRDNKEKLSRSIEWNIFIAEAFYCDLLSFPYFSHSSDFP